MQLVIFLNQIANIVIIKVDYYYQARWYKIN